MIHEVDEAIRSLLRADALAGTDVEILFDAPTTDWAARRTGPTLNVYLYDIRENLSRRTTGEKRILGGDGHVEAIAQPPRFYRLAYLITAWTQRPEDEHRLLSAVLSTVIADNRLPLEYLTGSLSDLSIPIEMNIALPAPDDRSVSDVWTALGGELKPSLDLVITAPLVPGRAVATPHLVLEDPRLGVRGPDGEVEVAGGQRQLGAAEGGRSESGDVAAGERGGSRAKGGKRQRPVDPQDPGQGTDDTSTEGAAEGGLHPGAPGTVRRRHVAAPAEETRKGGAGDEGRIIHIKEIR
jgi:hypothetical protein